MLLDEVSVNVPGVPTLGLVHKGLKKVAAGQPVGRCRRRAFALHWQCQRFSLTAFVEEAGDAAGLGINLQANKLVFERVSGSDQGRPGQYPGTRMGHSSPRLIWVHTYQLISGRWYIFRKHTQSHPVDLWSGTNDFKFHRPIGIL